MTSSSVIAKLTIYNNQMMIKQDQQICANLQIFEIWSTKMCRWPPSGWNFVSASESTRCTYIFSVRRWQRRSTVMIVAFATNCRSPPLFGRPGERCLCSALQCSANAATIAATNIFATISVLQYCCCCYKYCSCYLNAAATDMWLPKEMPLLCLW